MDWCCRWPHLVRCHIALFIGGNFNLAGTLLPIHCRGASERIGVGGRAVTLDCLGVPNAVDAARRGSDARFTQNLTSLLTTNPHAPNGWFRFTDPTPPDPAGFYRLHRE